MAWHTVGRDRSSLMQACTPRLFSYFFRPALQRYLRGCLSATSPPFICRIKRNSQSLGCAVFSVGTTVAAN